MLGDVIMFLKLMLTGAGWSSLLTGRLTILILAGFLMGGSLLSRRGEAGIFDAGGCALLIRFMT